MDDDVREALGNLPPLTDDDLLRIADRPGGVNDQLRAAVTEAEIDAAAEVIAEHRAGTVYPSDRAEARAILEAVREVARGLVHPRGTVPAKQISDAEALAKAWDEGVRTAGAYGHEDTWTHDMTPYAQNPYREAK